MLVCFVHAQCCHWLATSAAFTAKEVAWSTMQASGDGRHWLLVTFRKEHRSQMSTKPNWCWTCRRKMARHQTKPRWSSLTICQISFKLWGLVATFDVRSAGWWGSARECSRTNWSLLDGLHRCALLFLNDSFLTVKSTEKVHYPLCFRLACYTSFGNRVPT